MTLFYGTALANSQLSGTATGWLLCATVSVNGEFTYTSTAGTVLGAGDGQAEAVTFTPSDETDYSSVSASVVVNVTPALLTVTAASQRMTYGSSVPALTYTYAGLVSGDKMRHLQRDIDDHGDLGEPGGQLSDYGEHAGRDGQLHDRHLHRCQRVGQPRTADGHSDDKEHDLRRQRASVDVHLRGAGQRRQDATFSGALTTTATLASPVGSYPITENTLAATGNYTIGTFIGANVSVSPALLTVTATTKSMTYGGSVPALTYTYAGLVSGDKSATFSGALATSATSASPVGSYPITENTLAATGNYTIGTFIGANVSVSSAMLTVTATTKSMTYGGSVPMLTYTYAGLVSGDKSATFSGALATSATSASPVGSYPITENTLAATGNYTIGTFVGANVTVSPALLTVTAASQRMTYGGSVPALTYTYAGLVSGDKSATFSGALATSATSVSPKGNYPITENTLAATGNYTIGTFVGANVTVSPAPLTITANNATKIVGTPNPSFSVSYAGFVNGDTLSSLGGTLVITTTATTSSPAGAYPITPSGLTAVNYAITFVPGTLTVTAINFSIYVLDPAAAGAFTLSGDAFVNTTGNVVVDSKAGNAISASGNSGIMAASVQVVGGVSTSGNARVTKTGTPSFTSDPLAGLAGRLTRTTRAPRSRSRSAAIPLRRSSRASTARSASAATPN